MSGRAGRRGLDPTGVVIINADSDVPDVSSLFLLTASSTRRSLISPPLQVETLNHMLRGQPTKLQSQFRLTYSMILNLLRVEALRVEEMIKRSFSENASQRLLPEHQKKVAEVSHYLPSFLFRLSFDSLTRFRSSTGRGRASRSQAITTRTEDRRTQTLLRSFATNSRIQHRCARRRTLPSFSCQGLRFRSNRHSLGWRELSSLCFFVENVR